MAPQKFSVADYGIFAVLLTTSIAIGIFFSAFGGKQRTTREYLFGNNSMRSWSVAISLMASFLSAVSVLRITGEVYAFGAEFVVFVGFSFFLVMAVVNTFFLPIFHRLQVSSVNEVC